MKLASELRRPPHKHTMYILDEPTTGLSFSDVQQLIDVLLRLRTTGHSIVVIEHHLDVVKSADWIIDLEIQKEAMFVAVKLLQKELPKRLQNPRKVILVNSYLKSCNLLESYISSIAVFMDGSLCRLSAPEGAECDDALKCGESRSNSKARRGDEGRKRKLSKTPTPGRS